MPREGRLRSGKATDWVAKYEGKSIVRGYRKWFGVDSLCAIIELRLLGVHISEGYEEQVQKSIEGSAQRRKRRKIEREEAKCREMYTDSDDTFSFIVGYTSGGAPYGLAWEEIGGDPP